MTRYTFIVLVVIGSAATAVAAITPAVQSFRPNHNVTVIAMTPDFPYYGPVEVEECAVEDCSDE